MHRDYYLVVAFYAFYFVFDFDLAVGQVDIAYTMYIPVVSIGSCGPAKDVDFKTSYLFPYQRE